MLAAELRRLVSDELASDLGLEVVGIGRERAVALARTTQPNLVLVVLDVEMPEMDGPETLGLIARRTGDCRSSCSAP